MKYSLLLLTIGCFAYCQAAEINSLQSDNLMKRLTSLPTKGLYDVEKSSPTHYGDSANYLFDLISDMNPIIGKSMHKIIDAIRKLLDTISVVFGELVNKSTSPTLANPKDLISTFGKHLAASDITRILSEALISTMKNMLLTKL